MQFLSFWKFSNVEFMYCTFANQMMFAPDYQKQNISKAKAVPKQKLHRMPRWIQGPTAWGRMSGRVVEIKRCMTEDD